MRDHVRWLISPLLRCLLLASPLLLIPLTGCSAAGVIANSAPKPPVDAAYKGLAGQKIGVMVWVDRGVIIDHPGIERELARGVQDKLQEAVDAKVDEVKGTTFVKIEEIARFQEDHPELDGEDAIRIAPRLPEITRLIYVEISNLSMHPGDAVDLVRGDISANVKVYEVDNGKAIKGYDEHGLNVVYPDKCPPDGVPGLDPDDAYKKSLDEMSKEVAIRFFTHEADAE
jgi:hypothetical protein